METIEVHNPSDKKKKMIINKQDYDPDKHKLWGELELKLETKQESVKKKRHARSQY